MPRQDETRDDSSIEPVISMLPKPGLVLIVAAGASASHVIDVGTEGVEIGRATPPGLLEDDDRASRRHARVVRDGAAWTVSDLSSKNGTYVDGRLLASPASLPSPALIRIGRSLLWAIEDTRPFSGGARILPTHAGPIIGGALRRAYGEIAVASRAGDTVCLRGESGSGKELAARAFHDARYGPGTAAPFVAVNCAAIPEGLAERLLFGAKKGAYSGATADAEGYVQAADGGTLFLDEIAELDPAIQAKLLRVLEMREVLPLGASRPKAVSIAVCVASHKKLRDEVAAGRFREDLYFRIGRPEVVLPALRERLDEIPAFVGRELHGVDARLSASVVFVEGCCLRPWPGNVRELLREVRRAAHRALEAGRLTVEVEDLPSDAGARLSATESASAPPPAAARKTPPSDDEIRRALEENAGNVRASARALGMHRNQLRRWLEKHPGAASEPDGD